MRAWREQTNAPAAEYRQKIAAYETAKAEWDARHPDGILLLDDLPPCPPSRVSYNECGISLHVYGNDATYDLWPWCRVSTQADILWWVQHLCGKTWCDRQLIRDLVELTMSRLGKEVSE